MKTVAALGVLVLLLLASPATSQVPDDKLIVPGVRIGKWTLDTPVDDLIREFGSTLPPVTTPPGGPLQGGLVILVWTTGPISVFTRDRRRIEMMSSGLGTGVEVYKTEKSVGVGATGVSVLEAYGPPPLRVPANTNLALYDDIGIGFNISNDRVTAVFVFRPKTAAMIWRL